jgi:hypothetical protein
MRDCEIWLAMVEVLGEERASQFLSTLEFPANSEPDPNRRMSCLTYCADLMLKASGLPDDAGMVRNWRRTSTPGRPCCAH